MATQVLHEMELGFSQNLTDSQGGRSFTRTTYRSINGFIFPDIDLALERFLASLQDAIKRAESSSALVSVLEVYHRTLILFLVRATLQFTLQSPEQGYRASNTQADLGFVQDLAAGCISRCCMSLQISILAASFEKCVMARSYVCTSRRLKNAKVHDNVDLRAAHLHSAQRLP